MRKQTLLVALLFLSGCATGSIFIADPDASDLAGLEPEVDFRVFLVGDTYGEAFAEGDPIFDALHERLGHAGKNSALVFLGDLVPCCGMPDSTDVRRREFESIVERQLSVSKGFEGRVVVVPGDRDWNLARSGGREALARLERVVEAYLDAGNSFLPDDGFPGPVHIRLDDDVRLIAMDTQWWLAGDERATGDAGDYEISEEGDVLVQLRDDLSKYRTRHVLVVGHHPLTSNGRHAGRFSPRVHLSPPILGSLRPLYVSYLGGSPQDLAHPEYREMRTSLERIFAGHESLIYASAHDKSIQFFPGNHNQHLISGSGSKAEFAGRGRGASVAAGVRGYTELVYYKNGSVALQVWTGDDQPLYEKEIVQSLVAPEDSVVVFEDIPDFNQTETLAANPNYLAGPVKRLIQGTSNRKIWAIPVEVPVLDLGREAGGLTPIRRGGGMQTFSLRLMGGDGSEYALRSIDKDPSVSIPEEYRKTIVTNVVQDQIAGIHPYGAFALPKLAEAAGIFHTLPKLVYVPDDPRLGPYREGFRDMMMMLERRPDGDMSDSPNVGHSEDVISSGKLYAKLSSDNDDTVDALAFVKARLFDILLSDWDRHRGQWRWAGFKKKEGKGSVYKPVPTDRDWAFNRVNGALMWVYKNIVDPKFQDFTEDYGNLKGLTLNGLEQDRRFTAGVSRSEWIDAARDLQRRLSDDVFEQAISDWPLAVREYHGDEINAVFRARRSQLVEKAEEFYQMLARVVDIVGSDKHERFEIRRGEGETEVVMFKTSKDGEERGELLRRTFLHSETRELRLYGLAGDDRFAVTGESGQDAPLIRMVGGAGSDEFSDLGKIGNGSPRARIYDTVDTGNRISGSGANVSLSDDPANNLYDARQYKHHGRLVQVYPEYNSDDGVFLGGGLQFVRHGFRKSPFSSTHTFLGNLAFKTSGFNLAYAGRWTKLVGNFDGHLDVEYLSPNKVRNYYGLGNGTTASEASSDFYRARYSEFLISPALYVRSVAGSSLRMGPHFRVTNIDESDFLSTPQAGISDESLTGQAFVGASIRLDAKETDFPLNPRFGYRWTSSAETNIGVRNSDDVYSTFAASFSGYLSLPTVTQVTFAGRIGASRKYGEFPFYDAATLGGRENLRGWRSTRFAGRSNAYANAELRLALFEFSNLLTLGQVGAIGFFDVGRVWSEDPLYPSDNWHQSVGGGIWISLYDAFLVSGYLGFSEEQSDVSVKVGFLF